MNEVKHTEAQVTVWYKNSDGALHDGRAIEYVVTLGRGTPLSYQRTVYENGEVVATNSSSDCSEVPQYVRDEVEKHMIPKGSW